MLIFFIKHGSPQQGTLTLAHFIIFKHLINCKNGKLQKKHVHGFNHQQQFIWPYYIPQTPCQHHPSKNL
jgi:hypothetical protein